jgi:hypothetical protein
MKPLRAAASRLASWNEPARLAAKTSSEKSFEAREPSRTAPSSSRLASLEFIFLALPAAVTTAFICLVPSDTRPIKSTRQKAVTDVQFAELSLPSVILGKEADSDSVGCVMRG